METPNFAQINDQELTRTKLYPYKHLSTFRNTPKRSPKFNWHKSNVQGEMYEYLIYEKLLYWAIISENVSEFILKGPYVKNVTRSSNGLTYDRDYQIYYMSSGETICEFDALFRYDKYRIFVETKKMRIPRDLGKLKYDIERKYNVMKIIFPNDEIGCWIIAPDQKNITLAKFPNISGIPTPAYKLDPNILELEEYQGQVELSNSTGVILAHQCNHTSFDYLETLISVHEKLADVEPQYIRKAIKEFLEPYIGLIERVFMGKIALADLDTLLERRGQKALDRSLNVTDVYLAFKIKDLSSLSNTIYLKAKNNRCFEMSNMNNPGIKKIERRKRTTRDIFRIDKHLKTLTLAHVENYLSD